MLIEVIFAMSICANIVFSIIAIHRWRTDKETDKFIAEMTEKYKTGDDCPMCGAEIMDDEEESLSNVAKYFDATQCSICQGELNFNGDCKICGFNSAKFDEDRNDDNEY